jgi:YD repeat-containing protein
LGNALTGITDENGARYATWNWNCYNQATSSEHAGGVEKVSLAYTGHAADGTNTTTVTSYVGTAAAPQTVTRTYHYRIALGVAVNDAIDQPCQGCDGLMERTFDANNNVTSNKDWQGNKKVFTYDLTRNLETSRVEGYGTALARTITTEWHPTMRLRTKVAEPLRITSYTYDANGNMLSESVQATTDAHGASGFSATPDGTRKTWNFTYNDAGQLLTKTGPGVNTTLTYDNQGNLETVSNAAGHVTRYDNYDVNGRVGQITDPNGMVTSFSYGPRGWLDSVSSGGEVTSYTYDGVGNLKTVTMPDGTTTTYSYDDAHRLTTIADSLGNKISYTLDLSGNRIGEDSNDAGGQLTRRISRVFDTFNRLKQVTGAVQ